MHTTKASAKVNGNEDLKGHHWQHRGIEFAMKIATSARRKTSQGQESGIRKRKHGEERTDNNQLAKIARNGKPEAPKAASKMLARKLHINITGERVGGNKVQDRLLQEEEDVELLCRVARKRRHIRISSSSRESAEHQSLQLGIYSCFTGDGELIRPNPEDQLLSDSSALACPSYATGTVLGILRPRKPLHSVDTFGERAPGSETILGITMR